MQHVATWKEGDAHWAYRDDAAANIATHKVSLDPYRKESRRILVCIKEHLPTQLQRVEKASVDEVFLDLSAHVHSILLERYPELGGPPPYDDPTENLPLPPSTALDWNTDALVDLDDNETEDDDPDWDDIVMLIGSEIVRSVRAKIREKLSYTCSGGIAQNKMLSKLGSGHKKPNSQTVVRNRAIQQFLSGMKFTKIRNLGGKLGEQVVGAFGTDEVQALLPFSLEQLKAKLDADSGSFVYNVIRAVDLSEVNPRTQIKSMLSAKSFRPAINSREQAARWLRIFAADIHSRLVEEGVPEGKRRPRTINLHHRQGAQTRSRQLPVPSGKKIDETLLFDLATVLLGQVIVDGRAWPCSNLSLSVGGFEDGPSGNRGIGGFLIKGEEARAMNTSASRHAGHVADKDEERPGKRRRIEDSGIQKFFAKRESSREEDHDEEFGAQQPSEFAELGDGEVNAEVPDGGNHQLSLSASVGSEHSQFLRPDSSDDYTCPTCKVSIRIDEQAEHTDWHVAMDLQASERSISRHESATGAEMSGKPKTVQPKRGPWKPGGANGGSGEKGQMKLAFQ